ncbi:hypothetical protein C8T65DRAFT_579058 [Cerioporus squamosus]|nr:hypothetical protein C8T65DRAFT_579058 [Cerioporus squamosus]
MGRRPKYLTAEDRRAAKRAQAATYRRTEKGKATKSLSNKRYYTRKKAEQTVEDTSPAPLDVKIPDELRARGRKVLRACLALDDDEYGPTMGLWTSPYRFINPGVHNLYALPRPPWQSKRGLWESRVAVLGTFQYREVLTAGAARYERWISKPQDNIATPGDGEVMRRVAAWEELKDFEVEIEDELDDTDVRELTLDWGAKIVCMLVEEWECRTRRGLQGYEDAREAGDCRGSVW